MERGTKGLTNYYRTKNATLKRQAIMAAAICCFFLVLLAVYTLGRCHGFDRGCTFAERALERALVEGIRDGMPYRMEGIDISFRPWKARQDTATIRLVNMRALVLDERAAIPADKTKED